MPKFLQNLLNWFVTTKAWVMFARHILAHFTFRVFGYPKFPMSKYIEIKKALENDPEGLYTFTSADTDSLAWRATHMVSGADWGHAGFVRLEDGEPHIWHMKGTGRTRGHLLDLLRECDNFALVKMPLKGDNLKIAKQRFQTLIEAPEIKYNYTLAMPKIILGKDELFVQGTKGSFILMNEDKTFQKITQVLHLFCSEWVYVVGAGLVDDPDFVASWEFGRYMFDPDDVFNGGDPVFVHKSEQ